MMYPGPFEPSWRDCATFALNDTRARLARRFYNMLGRWLALGLVLASGCAAAPDPLDAPATPQPLFDHVRAVRVAWRAHGLPELSTACAEEVNTDGLPTGPPNLAIVYMPRASIGACAEEHGCLFGSTILVDDAIRGTKRVDAVVEHHLRHWFAECSLGQADDAHALDTVWYDDARDES